ncbi:MAG: globin [Phenylobacterium sp.]|uniref:globin n=1 Tax=Phenylobacterium sp. TaxID=1871053 RepID=UPI0025DDDC6F|nr:globin [Phenylobacterium sp.]MCA3756688.1 globin [Phenylobacterium sp.]
MPRAPDPREPLIVASFELAAERSEDLTPDVYARLFREQPEMEILFWRDTNHQIRGEMLTRVIQAILDFVGERLYSRTLIQSEVVVHEGYDVPPDVFRTFFATVRDAVREVCGDDWRPEWEAAWETTLADLDWYVTNPDQAMTPA